MRLVVVGPTRAGKTAITNILSGIDALSNCPVYRPTVGVRIVDAAGTNPVCIYDTSGNAAFRSLIPSFCEGSTALIIVWPMDTIETVTLAQLEAFTQNAQINPSKCILVATDFGNATSRTQQAPKLAEIADTSMKFTFSDPKQSRMELINWIASIADLNI
jgi:GTPase SAR1 family protein